jgi:hypothetical protein
MSHPDAAVDTQPPRLERTVAAQTTANVVCRNAPHGTDCPPCVSAFTARRRFAVPPCNLCPSATECWRPYATKLQTGSFQWRRSGIGWWIRHVPTRLFGLPTAPHGTDPVRKNSNLLDALAEAGRTRARGARSLAKAAGTADTYESV